MKRSRIELASEKKDKTIYPGINSWVYGTPRLRYFHIWFATKHRKRILLNVIDEKVKTELGQIAVTKGINLITYETMPEHVHLLVGLRNDQLVSQTVKLFKGISSRNVFIEFPFLKYQKKTNNLWSTGYAYKEIPKDRILNVIEYINDQRKHFHSEEAK